MRKICVKENSLTSIKNKCMNCQFKIPRKWFIVWTSYRKYIAKILNLKIITNSLLIVINLGNMTKSQNNILRSLKQKQFKPLIKMNLFYTLSTYNSRHGQGDFIGNTIKGVWQENLLWSPEGKLNSPPQKPVFSKNNVSRTAWQTSW